MIRSFRRIASSAPRRAALGLGGVAFIGTAGVVAHACTAGNAAVAPAQLLSTTTRLTPDRDLASPDEIVAVTAPTQSTAVAPATTVTASTTPEQSSDLASLAAIRTQCVASWQSWRTTDTPEDTAETAAWQAAMAQGATSVQAMRVNDIAEDASERSARLASMAPCLAAIRAFAVQERTEVPTTTEPALTATHAAPFLTAPAHTTTRTWSRDAQWSWWGGRTWDRWRR